jgi:hypothetical protein
MAGESPAWIQVGPPHTAWNSCDKECAARGLSCREEGCASFAQWDGKEFTGGERLTSGMTVRYECGNDWGPLFPDATNFCCCGR